MGEVSVRAHQRHVHGKTIEVHEGHRHVDPHALAYEIAAERLAHARQEGVDKTAALEGHHAMIARRRQLAKRLEAPAKDPALHAHAVEAHSAISESYPPEDDHKVENALIMQHRKLIEGEARSWAHKVGLAGVDVQDLQQGAYMAGLKALQRRTGDNRQSVPQLLRSAVSQALFRNWRAIVSAAPFHVTGGENESLSKLVKAQSKIWNETGREATDPELAAELGVTPRRVNELKRLYKDIYSRHLEERTTDQYWGETTPELHAAIADPNADHADRIAEAESQAQIKAKVHAALEEMQQRHGDPLARVMMVHDRKLDDQGASLEALIAHQKMPEIARTLRRAAANLGIAPMFATEEQQAQLASHTLELMHEPSAPGTQRHTLALNIYKFGGDHRRMLTTPKMTPGGNMREGVAPADLAVRLGFKATKAKELTDKAERFMRGHAGLRALRDDSMAKSLLIGHLMPELDLIRSLIFHLGPIENEGDDPTDLLAKGELAPSPIVGVASPVCPQKAAEVALLLRQMREG